MVQFYILYFLYAVIVQPITIVLGFILRLLYHMPKMLRDAIPADIPSVNDMANLRMSTLDRNFLLTNGDCAKFLGMYAWATGRDEDWDNIMRLCDPDNKCFHRTPVVPDPENEVIFSGDMLSGVMGAIADRLLTKGLTDNDKNILSTIWNYTSWKGWPMVFTHPTKGKDIFNRGCIWRPWRIFDTFDVLELLVWLYLGYKITSKKSYLIAYYFVYIISAPMLFISTHDGTFFIGRVYALSAHNSHSQMLNIITGYRLSESWIFKDVIRRIMKRRENISPDMLALYHAYVKPITAEQQKRFEELVYSTYIKGTNPILEDWKVTYMSVDWPINFPKNSKYVLPPSYRGNDYSDERSIIKGRLMSEDERARWSLDVIFPVYIMQK